jgi:hypothetical protein
MSEPTSCAGRRRIVRSCITRKGSEVESSTTRGVRSVGAPTASTGFDWRRAGVISPQGPSRVRHTASPSPSKGSPAISLGEPFRGPFGHRRRQLDGHRQPQLRALSCGARPSQGAIVDRGAPSTGRLGAYGAGSSLLRAPGGQGPDLRVTSLPVRHNVPEYERSLRSVPVMWPR